MDVFNEFKKYLKKYGLEYFGRYYSVYRGFVADNKDPDFLGRVKIRVPQIYGNTIPDVWAYPRGLGLTGKGHGVFLVPSVGDPIYVSFEGGDPKYPLFESGWWISGNTPESAKVENQNCYLFQTPEGRRIELNDHEKKILIEDKSGFKVVIDEKGLFIGKEKDNLGQFLTDLFDIISKTSAGPYTLTTTGDFAQLALKIKDFLSK